jgi:hypothetical protein
MVALGGVLGGLYIDLMRHFFPDATWGKDFYYRFAPVWPLPFLILGMIFLILLYREWKKLGGEAHYVPPGSGDINPEIVPEKIETAETGLVKEF